MPVDSAWDVHLDLPANLPPVPPDRLPDEADSKSHPGALEGYSLETLSAILDT